MASFQHKRQRVIALSAAGNRCRRCSSGSDLTVHHIKPRALGGPDSAGNYAVLCRPCHDAWHRVEGHIGWRGFQKWAKTQREETMKCEVTTRKQESVALCAEEAAYSPAPRETSKRCSLRPLSLLFAVLLFWSMIGLLQGEVVSAVAFGSLIEMARRGR